MREKMPSGQLAAGRVQVYRAYRNKPKPVTEQSLAGSFAGTAGGAACENEGVLADLAAGTWSGVSVCMQEFCKIAMAKG